MRMDFSFISSLNPLFKDSQLSHYIFNFLLLKCADAAQSCPIFCTAVIFPILLVHLQHAAIAGLSFVYAFLQSVLNRKWRGDQTRSDQRFFRGLVEPEDAAQTNVISELVAAAWRPIRPLSVSFPSWFLHDAPCHLQLWQLVDSSGKWASTPCFTHTHTSKMSCPCKPGAQQVLLALWWMGVGGRLDSAGSDRMWQRAMTAASLRVLSPRICSPICIYILQHRCCSCCKMSLECHDWVMSAQRIIRYDVLILSDGRGVGDNRVGPRGGGGGVIGGWGTPKLLTEDLKFSKTTNEWWSFLIIFPSLNYIV